ncbi:hypothetical protein M9H77_23367 [Catharanthus roseus]|uniref:Uncharacterized protein n=1 Tax=Catharanthus roseus TaxID=4058 RepID=A0ACC0AT27_CATRO|nr:hypothetical protein M9H77_23367 [Catharanthus roseus]
MINQRDLVGGQSLNTKPISIKWKVKSIRKLELPNGTFSEGWEPNQGSYLVVKASGMNPLKVPLSKPSQTADGVSVWEWEGSAFDEGYEASKWFSSYLGKESRLVRFNEVKLLGPIV